MTSLDVSGFTNHLCPHNAWHSPDLSSPTPGQSDKQNCPPLLPVTPQVQSKTFLCLCVCVHVWVRIYLCESNLTGLLKSGAPWSRRLKPNSETLSQWSYSQAQASIHNQRALCNSQCDQPTTDPVLLLVLSVSTTGSSSSLSRHRAPKKYSNLLMEISVDWGNSLINRTWRLMPVYVCNWSFTNQSDLIQLEWTEKKTRPFLRETQLIKF